MFKWLKEFRIGVQEQMILDHGMSCACIMLDETAGDFLSRADSPEYKHHEARIEKCKATILRLDPEHVVGKS